MQNGGRNYVKVADRPSGPAHRPSAHMHLLGRPLLSLDSGGQLPTVGDVIKYVRGKRMEDPSKKIAEVICCPRLRGSNAASCLTSCLLREGSNKRCAVAEMKKDSWLVNGIPMKQDFGIAVQMTKSYHSRTDRLKDRIKKSAIVEVKDAKFKEESTKNKMDITTPAARDKMT